MLGLRSGRPPTSLQILQLYYHYPAFWHLTVVSSLWGTGTIGNDMQTRTSVSDTLAAGSAMYARTGASFITETRSHST